jgi:hypothetical protein
MLGVFGPPVLLFLLIVGGLYLYNEKFGDSPSTYDQAISDCVRDRTRVSASTDVQEQVTSDCVRETAPEGGR